MDDEQVTAPLAPPEATGVEDIDAALQAVHEADPADRVEVLEQAHERLRDILNDG